MKPDAKLEYKVWAAAYFVITFVLIGFAIVSLVQGIRLQFSDQTGPGLVLYSVAPLIVLASYLSYRKAHHKLNVLAISKV